MSGTEEEGLVGSDDGNPQTSAVEDLTPSLPEASPTSAIPDTPQIGDRHKSSPYDVTIEFRESGEVSVPRVCYAIAHNRIPFVDSLIIRVADSSVPKKLTIKVFGEWAANNRSPIKEAEFALDAPTTGTSVEIAPVHQIQLSDVALTDLEELAPAALIIEIHDDLGRLQTVRRDIDIYSRDQWLNHPRYAVVLASFVQPNHPDVIRILARASAILSASGNPGLSGYQDTENGQQHRIAKAIFMALQELITTYINPPASFEELGQRVRPIDRVLEEKQGTCIDLACAYASCLEQAGLHPVIFIVSGHAFGGYLTDATSLPNGSVLSSWPAIQSLLDSGRIIGVETVGIPNGLDFDSAIVATQQNLNEFRMRSIIDVFQAHREGVRPLPARIIRDNVITVVIDNGPGKPAITERRDAKTRKLLPESVPARIQSWKSSLLDLSFRNRLLNLKPERHGIRLLPPIGYLGHIEDHLNNGGHIVALATDALNEIQAQVVQRGGDLPLDQLVDFFTRTNGIFSSTETKRFKALISRLRSDARLQEEESGANSLYLTLGSVKWSAKYGDYVSPLFLVPVRIASLRGLNGAIIEMDATQSTTVNYCLIEALRLREDLTLQWFSDDMSDDLGMDIEAGLEALRSEFREKGLDVQGFSVDQSSSVSLLNFEKFRLWKDLNDHWKDFMKSPVVKHLVETPRETFQDPAGGQITSLVVSDTSTICAQPADGSQIGAVERALAGLSFVLQGPPGSGKSQTITNLLANAMNRGKKVLFVAEKQSALQEVQERLEAVKLGPYCLVLHDSGTKPEDLRAQLRAALDQRPTLDERKHRAGEDDFAAAARQLDEYRTHVYAPNNAGFSFASAYFRLGELGEGPVVAVPREFLATQIDRVAELQRGLLSLDDLTRPARVAPQHPWSLVGNIRFESLDRSALSGEISAALASCKLIESTGSGVIREALARTFTADDITLVAEVLNLRELGHMPILAEWQSISASTWRSSVETLLNEYSFLLQSVAQDVVGKEEILRRTDLDTVVTVIKEAAKSFALGRKKRVREVLGPFAAVVSFDSIEPVQVVAKVFQIAGASSKVRNMTTSLRDLKGLGSLLTDEPVKASDIENLLARTEVMAKIAQAISDPGLAGASLRTLVASPEMAIPGLSTTIRKVADNLRDVYSRLDATTETIQRWAQDVGVFAAANSRSRDMWEEIVRTGNFLSLQRWINLGQHLAPYRDAGLGKMCLAIEDGVLVADDVARAFERGLLTTTLHVRAEETDLDVFDSVQQDRRVRKFIQLLDDRREQAQTVIPYFLYKSRSINAGVTTGKIGEFRREVNTPSKRKRGRSIRNLIERYPDIISDLTPCFLMSPDSVAQFLPPGTLNFDIVVFDEASQIVVADAVGAMGRAQSCVIVGDSKQMPPTRFAMVDMADVETTELLDEGGVEEEESILEEAVTAGFHQELLTWHYRSQDESLIAFSNEHYYDNRLSTFPAPVPFRPDFGVFYVRVNGQFDHGKSRTNEIEARAIIDELVRRLDDPATAGLSYGIVTLNIQQRNLITELIDRHGHPLIKGLRQTDDKKRRLFILNLENVQGRERDVILFGTSFSTRVGGGAMSLNFGPLTNKGGEKRLNVAVTRAKRQFVVVSSFDPNDMADAKSLGMVHLREYLRAAEMRATRRKSLSTAPYSILPQVKIISDRLEQRGIKVQIGHGLSNFKIDLALTLPELGDKWLVAVLFDGEEWSQRPLAIDRDALPVTVLENVMNWRRVARVWMPAIRLELDSVIEALIEHVRVAKEMPEPTPPVASPSSQSTSMPNSSGSEESGVAVGDLESKNQPPITPQPTSLQEISLPNETPFTAYQFPHVPYGQDALLTTYARDLVEQLVDSEGPMLAVEALKRVAYEFGLQRVRDAKVLELSPLLGTRLVTEDLDDHYVWPATLHPDTWRGFRRTSTDLRKVESVTPYEIVNAMEVTVRRSITISPDELIKWTAEFFGAARATARLKEYFTECISWAKDTGRFIEDNGQLTCA